MKDESRIIGKGIRMVMISLIVLMAGCSGGSEEDLRAKAKEEILQAEKAFQQMAREKGIAEAFSFFADEEGIVLRGDSLVKGKEIIRSYYSSRKGSLELNWTPDFVDAASSGDLGYTYGHYTFTATDSTGTKREGSGVFHTVWKKQADGSWRFVWD